MRSLIFAAFAVASTSTPALANPDQDESLVVRGERAVCTRVELRGGSRIAYQRVCRTPTEWRERLGPDWQQVLAGRSPEDDLDTVDMLNRSTLEVPGSRMSRSFGRPGGGSSGPR